MCSSPKQEQQKLKQVWQDHRLGQMLHSAPLTRQLPKAKLDFRVQK
jgi:hypothetical protein